MEEEECNSKAQGAPVLVGNLSPPRGPPSLDVEVCSSLMREADFFFSYILSPPYPPCC